MIVNASYEYVRTGVLVTSQGVGGDGRRELLAVAVVDTESEAPYDDLSRRLKDRDLHGVRLITSDDHRWPVNAIQKHSQLLPPVLEQTDSSVGTGHSGWSLARRGQRWQRTPRRCSTPPPAPGRALKDEVVERWSGLVPEAR